MYFDGADITISFVSKKGEVILYTKVGVLPFVKNFWSTFASMAISNLFMVLYSPNLQGYMRYK